MNPQYHICTIQLVWLKDEQYALPLYPINSCQSPFDPSQFNPHPYRQSGGWWSNKAYHFMGVGGEHVFIEAIDVPTGFGVEADALAKVVVISTM